jgi:hypothetical protein
MPLCSECRTEFFPRDYLHLCDECGDQLQRSYDQLQEFRAGVLGFEVISGRVMFGESETKERVWRVG